MTRAEVVPAAAFGLVLAVSLAVAIRFFPDPAMYHMVADEGAYYFQASTVRNEGLAGFRKLARDYLSDPVQQGLPAPNRVGHILLASLALRINPSIRSLSVLSLVCFAATTVAVFLFSWRHWNPLTACVIGVLAGLSPLGLGLARRALMDSESGLFTVLTLLLCVQWLTNGRARTFAAFAAALTMALLVKETAWLFLPFFVAAPIIARAASHRSVPTAQIVCVAVGIPALAAAVSMALLGPTAFLEIVRVSARTNAMSPNPYLVAYGSGPWYQYFISLLLLSPVVALLFMVFAGAYVGRGEWHLPTSMLLSFFVYAIAVLAMLPKNPRLILPLDAVVRVSAGVAIVWVASRARAVARPAAMLAGGGLMAAAVLSDVSAFERYFARLDVYDPVTFALFDRQHMAPPSANWGTEKLADEYLELSRALARAGDYGGAVRAGRSALLWRPNDAAAYAAIGLAYCELQQWSAAVAALEAAVKIDPRLPAASENLARARHALGGGTAQPD